ncbi:hypothetical protein HWV62_19393 [Athelia sp. TMB]|nr:hypothetical protein HWV62_19393 [Athelia sp. TMB]
MERSQLEYISNHVFFPPKLPQEDDYQVSHERALCESLVASALEYKVHAPASDRDRWGKIKKMLENLRSTQESEALSQERIRQSIAHMKIGDVLALYIRAQNAGIIIRRTFNESLFESFEVSLPNKDVMAAEGKILRCFPGPAIAVPHSTASDQFFIKELSSFLVHMHVDVIDPPTTKKAGSEVDEVRDTTAPYHITQLLTGILRGMGRPVEVERIQKRIADDVLWKGALAPWRRSPIWLIIRVALQTSLSGSGKEEYKAFMVYALARMLDDVLQNDALVAEFPSDVLFCMRSKICRRLYKVGSVAPAFVQKKVQEVAEATQTLLQRRWSLLQSPPKPQVQWAPETLNIPDDTTLSLHHSGEYLRQVLRREAALESEELFKPQCTPRLQWPLDFAVYGTNNLSDAAKCDPYTALADFEAAVQESLEMWVDHNLEGAGSCDAIAACFKQYHDSAQPAYKKNPESLSIMLLTLAELWVAVDRLAIAQIPLLREYLPEIPTFLMEPLLLRSSQSLERVKYVETYVLSRHGTAHTSRRIFTDEISSQSFVIRYFESSSHLTELWGEIKRQATSDRNAKLAELRRLNTEHQDLVRKYEGQDHTYSLNRWGRKSHDNWCNRCQLEQQADRMSISIHEWPLPADDMKAKAAVFELSYPSCFGTWREITYQFLRDICLVDLDSEAADSPVQLRMYQGLTSFRGVDCSHRIGFASTTKAFTSSHYANTQIPSYESKVCVNNGLSFKLFDHDRNEWAAISFEGCSVVDYCTFQIPTGPYKSLQYAVSKTSHTSNDMLADQDNCSTELTFHEYAAFVGLRAGERLQWLNMARELRARTLTFRREEVFILLSQAAWQIGPLLHGQRDWHAELSEGDFASVLLQELSDLLTAIQSNWAEVKSARIITALTSRLLASTNDPEAIDQAYVLMRRARSVAIDWMYQLVDRLKEAEDDDRVQDLQCRMCEVASTCRSTYDVDPMHLLRLLSDEDDLAVLLECTIKIHDNTPPNLAGLSLDFVHLLDRDRRLSHSLEKVVISFTQSSPLGLESAITALWPRYLKGSDGWHSLASPDNRWIASNTSSTQRVHFNFLDGVLLVDGKPLSRLPESYSRHSTYTRIFGGKIFHVIPAEKSTGMDFAVCNKMYDHQVSFAMHDDGHVLVIRLARDDQVLELIPHDFFVNDLPSSFIYGYSHWMDIASGQMELRPLSNIWEASPENWTLFLLDQEHPIMRKHSTALVDIRSPTFQMVYASLQALDHRDHLVVKWCSKPELLSVELPRLRLTFMLNNSSLLESLNLSNMVVDENQSTGTMIGLSNQLVLRETDTILGRLPRSRRVIIPFGKISFGPRGHHTAVQISTNTALQTSVKFYEYKVDNELGRLISDGSLFSKLYKAYLHALCSHCLPDPLTGHTGTQEALQCIDNADCISFQKLEHREISLLQSIGDLAPTHIYYPKHLEVMQTVDWLCISTLAQNQSFHWAAISISNYAERLRVFEGPQEPDIIKATSSQQSSDAHLQRRAARRMALYHPDQTTKNHFPLKADLICPARDFAMQEGPKNEETPACVTSAVLGWPSTLDTVPKLFETLENWRSVNSERATLSYSREWLVRDLASTWLTIYNICRQSNKDEDLFRLAFSFSAMAYSSEKNAKLVPMLLTFATNPRFRSLDPPPWRSYDLALGFEPSIDQIRRIVRSHGSYESSSESRLPAYAREDEWDAHHRRRRRFEERLDDQAARVARHCLAQWPIQSPNLPSTPSDAWVFSAAGALSEIHSLFDSRFQNLQLKKHVDQVQSILDSTACFRPVGKATYHPPRSLRPSSWECCTLVTQAQLFQRAPPSISGQMPVLKRKVDQQYENLAAHFTTSANSFEKLYGEGLEHSQKEFMASRSRIITSNIPSLSDLFEYGDECLKSLQTATALVRDSLSPVSTADHMIHLAGQWPYSSLGSLLKILGTRATYDLSAEWTQTLALLAQRMLLYQRSRRMLHLAQLGSQDDFIKEYENETYSGAQKLSHTIDWLLIQIDGNFLARSLQIDVANEMICPASRANSVMQLNMGEGKSSVIVPMICTSLADGHKLTRVVVLKTLSGQMFQLLVERLGGLANRRIFYLPFSRAVKLGRSQVEAIAGLYKECASVGGILVAQPEHILSFKLMVVEHLLNSSNEAISLLKVQRWLEEHCRDILDESDEILHVRYQLLYTIGRQQALEGHPDRWTTVQQVLSLVRKHASQVHLHVEFPQGLEVQESRHGRFPITRILRPAAGERLMQDIMMDIMDGHLANFPFGPFPPDLRHAAQQVISAKEVQVDMTLQKLIDYCDGSGLWNGLLLLRGLFAHGILSYALGGKRWRVDYGLDLSRSLLAVPYRAKDVPAARAEFGHPDVAIVLTCLSYLYGGLSNAEMTLCFELLFKLDNPTMEYERWVRNDPSIPENFQQLSSINMDDPQQRADPHFPKFQINHSVVDFYLSQVVFPRAAKEFPSKLTTSGWDLAEEKTELVTGFSGTNDNQHLLPTSITQCDPLGQSSTNAKVLQYIMRPENEVYRSDHEPQSRRFSTKAFLDILNKQSPEIRVLLDVGAQMLDMSNKELARYWLDQWLVLHPDGAVQAVVYFDKHDNMTVMTKGGLTEPLISSPYRQQLDQCLVYLDDAHTRGTDLKLPRNTRAAVTLGPKTTKDRLTQGCMRLRKLGHGQSVMFFASLEVHDKILECALKRPGAKVETVDILRWSMKQTCKEIQHNGPLWADQGYDHDRRSRMWKTLDTTGSSTGDMKTAWERPEARTLAELYGAGLVSSDNGGHVTEFNEHRIDAIAERCEILGVSKLAAVQVDEEQEREVDHEMETERHVERPPKEQAAKHHVHPDIRQLVVTGITPDGSSQFISVFSIMPESPLTPAGCNTWSRTLLATRDFASTVQGRDHGDYLRPVHWMLSSKATGHESDIILLSPYEANELLPEIRKSKYIHLHMYSPRVTQAMRSLESLRFYCVPCLPRSWRPPPIHVIDQLNIWAGHLYLADHATYERLCRFLGLSTEKVQCQGMIETQVDGFIKPEHRSHSLVSECTFERSPVPFLKDLIGFRRKGMGYSLTHMGRILGALPLTEEDFPL